MGLLREWPNASGTDSGRVTAYSVAIPGQKVRFEGIATDLLEPRL
jgi:hypothetical protein